jgi:hypothetical protein
MQTTRDWTLAEARARLEDKLRFYRRRHDDDTGRDNHAAPVSDEIHRLTQAVSEIEQAERSRS